MPNLFASEMLERGKAAEHIVCADLILKGYRSYLSDQGLPYDVVIDHQDRLLRVQVKGTLKAKNVSASGSPARLAYSWNVRRRGVNGKGRLSNQHCDIVALVALDIYAVAYFPVDKCSETIALNAPGHHPKTVHGKRGWGRSIDQYPIDIAINNNAKFYLESLRTDLTHCPKGHEYTIENTRIYRGSRGCIECGRTRQREKHRRNHPGLKIRRID